MLYYPNCEKCVKWIKDKLVLFTFWFWHHNFKNFLFFCSLKLSARKFNFNWAQCKRWLIMLVHISVKVQNLHYNSEFTSLSPRLLEAQNCICLFRNFGFKHVLLLARKKSLFYQTKTCTIGRASLKRIEKYRKKS